MLYRPCPELTANLIDSVLTLKTPWLGLDIEFNPRDSHQIEAALKALQKGEGHPSLDWLLSRLCQYPICSILPRRVALLGSLRGILREPELMSRESVGLAESLGLRQVLPDRVNPGPAWPVQDLLGFARMPRSLAYDGLSLFSLLRLRHCASQAEAGPHVYEDLLQADEEAFLQFARVYVRQNHYVTTRAIASLQAGLGYEPYRPVLGPFVASEQGHDRLLWQSLQALGVAQPDEVEVFPEVRDLVALLAFCATRYRVALAVLIDLFERESPGEEHPMARLLLQSERGRDAALGLMRHVEINHRQEHDGVGFRLASVLPPVGRASALATIHLAEMGWRLRERIMQRVHDTFVGNLQRAREIPS